MHSHFCVSVAFLGGAFHGRKDGGEPEWPTSPLRLFQALVAACAGRWGSLHFQEYAAPALRWLEKQPPPIIVAPTHQVGTPYRIAVPNNDLDVVAASWARGQEPRKQANELKTMKTVRPTRVPEERAVYYLWELPEPVLDQFRGHAEVLSSAARSIAALGWGADLVAVNGQTLSGPDVERLVHAESHHVWRPTADRSSEGLRAPTEGTLADLLNRHAAFLGRVSQDGKHFNPVPPLTAFTLVGYRRETDVAPSAFAAFAFLSSDAETYRAFNTVRRTPAVAGMVRCEMAKAGRVYRPGDSAWVDSCILGHGGRPNEPAITDKRYAYLPLPTIEERKQNGPTNCVVGSIRRVLVLAPPGSTDADIAWVRQRLSGQLLIDEESKAPVGTLTLVPKNDRRLRWYVGERGARVWSTVTPVILPGYDDRDTKKTERLLRTALGQAGYLQALRDQAALEWRAVGFRPGLDLARRYTVNAHHKALPRYHVRITWPVPVRGPVCLGTGRYYGMGLFAAEEGS